MNINDVKNVVDRIVLKEENLVRYNEIKNLIDRRTKSDGSVHIMIEKEALSVDATELKKVIDKQIATFDTSADVVELKNKTK